MRMFHNAGMEYSVRNQNVILALTVPKDNETGPLVAEQIFATLHGIAEKPSFWRWHRGGRKSSPQQISFELASFEGIIRFYVHCQNSLCEAVKAQIYAQYPGTEIEEIPVDFFNETAATLSTSAKNAVYAELALTDPDFYPIKRHPQFEDKKARFALDPLAAMTATFAQFNLTDEQAWIQIVVRPLAEKWRICFIKCIRILKKGIFMNIESLQKSYARAFCSRSTIIRIMFFPLYLFFWFQGLFAGTKTPDVKTIVYGSEVEEQISKLHERETAMVAAIDKVGKLLYEVNIRLMYFPEIEGHDKALLKLREMAGAFKQFNIPHLNGFCIKKIIRGHMAFYLYSKRKMYKPFVLNIEELATIWHLPNVTVTTPNIGWVRSKKLEPPRDLPVRDNCAAQQFTHLGKINFRNHKREFGIKTIDRRRHVYIIGKTGMGKSTLLENMIFEDIYAGRGVGVIDPHGDLADRILNFIPSSRTNDVALFDPSDRDFPPAFNMLANVDGSLRSMVCSGLVGAFKKIYGQSWGPRLEYILRNTILALLEYPNTTMLAVPRLLQDRQFRSQIMRKITDPVIKNFWLQEFEQMNSRQRIEAISPILNKVGQFLSSPIMRNIVGQPKSALDLRFAMDRQKIVIINLAKGKIGEDISSLLGALLITKFQLDAMGRANLPERERVDFYLYVDEFQNFATDAFATILSEARKYRLNLVLANQYIGQMPEEVRDAVFGNVGTIAAFQLGFEDGEVLSAQFGEEILSNDLVGLGKYSAYIRLLIDGMPSKTFSFDTLPPPRFKNDPGRREKIVKLSHERYCKPREVVEERIKRWSFSSQ